MKGVCKKKKIKKDEISLVLVIVMVSHIKNEPPPYDEGFVFYLYYLLFVGNLNAFNVCNLYAVFLSIYCS